jgi:hypothetical protein
MSGADVRVVDRPLRWSAALRHCRHCGAAALSPLRRCGIVAIHRNFWIVRIRTLYKGRDRDPYPL